MERCGDVIESFCPVVSASGIEGDPVFRLHHFQPVAVEFQFISPTVPLRYFGDPAGTPSAERIWRAIEKTFLLFKDIRPFKNRLNLPRVLAEHEVRP
jgi:hypothetical protein